MSENEESLSRRGYLVTTGSAVAALAGCSDSEDVDRTDDANQEIDVNQTDDSQSNDTANDETGTDSDGDPLEDVEVALKANPENPEIGENVVLTADVTGEEPDSVSWDLGDGTELNSENLNNGEDRVEHAYWDTGEFNPVFTAGFEGTGEQLTADASLDVDHWDNLDMRMKHVDFYPRVRNTDRAGYGITVVDEDKIRRLTSEEVQEEREARFQKEEAISSIIDYDKMPSFSYSSSADSSPGRKIEYEEMDKAIERLMTEMNLDKEGDGYMTFTGKIEPEKADEVDVRFPVEHKIAVFPDENIIDVQRDEIYVDGESNVINGNGGERIEATVDVYTGRSEDVKYLVQDYLESRELDNKGIIKDRWGHFNLFGFARAGDFSRSDFTDAGGSIEPREDRTDLNNRYVGFAVSQMRYDPNEDKVYENLMGPFGDSELLDENDISRRAVDRRFEFDRENFRLFPRH